MIKKHFLCLILILFCCHASKAQTQVSLHFYNAGSQEFSVSNAGKIYFDNGYLFIDDGNTVPFSFQVSTIQKMLFSAPANLSEIETANFKIYPNPANNFIKISSNRSENDYQILSMDGRLVMTGSCRNEESINISALSKGLYLIKVDGQTFKISKL